MLVHIANVFMSILTSGRVTVKLDPSGVQTAQRLMRRDDDEFVPNPCSLYLLNLAIDVGSNTESPVQINGARANYTWRLLSASRSSSFC